MPTSALRSPGAEVDSHEERGVVDRILHALVPALWFTVIPVLLAAAAVGLLIPPVVPGGGGSRAVIVSLALKYPLVVGAILFLIFSGIARYWRFYLPGRRYASTLPANLIRSKSRGQLREFASAAALHRTMSTPVVRGSLKRNLSEVDGAVLEERLRDLREGVVLGDEKRLRQVRSVLEKLAAPGVARQETREAVKLTCAVAVAAGAALGLRGWIADSYTVLSASMLPTLAPGDVLAGYKLATRSPKRGDIVIFPSPASSGSAGQEHEQLIKRVIGLPGDRVAMSGGVPIINGWRTPTCDVGSYVYISPDKGAAVFRAALFVEFLDDHTYLTVQAAASREFTGTYEVKPDEVFVLGDNRSNSADSRFWNGGAGAGVPLDSITASAQWFLSGSRLDGRPDLERMFHRLRSLEGSVHVEGADIRTLEGGIERCLNARPTDTSPPAPPREAMPRNGS